MTVRPLLVTAFEPFGGDVRNPSAEVLAALVETVPGLVTEVLPVVYTAAGRRIERLLAEVRPSAWVGLGLHAGAEAVRIERVAANWDEASLADNAGDVRAGVAIDPGGPPVRPATVPVEAMLAAAGGGRAVPSDSAGRFVCNHTFYRAATAAGRMDPPPAVGFVHVPWPCDWPGRRVGHGVTFADGVATVTAILAAASGAAGAT